MRFKSEIMNEVAINRALIRMSHEIIERNRGAKGIILVGIKSRGYPLAKAIANNIKQTDGTEIKVYELDASQFRDDVECSFVQKAVLSTDITGYKIIMVDDVLYTGRTARAAMEALIKSGRPASIQLAVLVDRGHRELPIHADYVGKNLPTSRSESITVKVKEYDGEYSVCLYEK